jgi:hypothetical protein
MEDRSLDDFLDPGSDDEGTTDETSRDDTGDGSVDTSTDQPTVDETPDHDGTTAGTGDGRTAVEGVAETERDAGSEAVEPAVSTSAWDPEGGACVACGGTVGRRWQGESGLVCPDCKEW